MHAAYHLPQRTVALECRGHHRNVFCVSGVRQRVCLRLGEHESDRPRAKPREGTGGKSGTDVCRQVVWGSRFSRRQGATGSVWCLEDSWPLRPFASRPCGWNQPVRHCRDRWKLVQETTRESEELSPSNVRFGCAHFWAYFSCVIRSKYFGSTAAAGQSGRFSLFLGRFSVCSYLFSFLDSRVG
jgi:hypothetical protein